MWLPRNCRSATEPARRCCRRCGISEDVDLSFDRAGLGFGGASDPLNAPTGKRRKHGLEALTETCQRIIREQFLPQLTAVFGNALGEPPSTTWGLELAEDDPDGQ